MLLPGLVSVTFRNLAPREIVDACVAAQLEGVEWGGDVHAPPADLDSAREVGQMTREAGLQVAAYGSYFRALSEFEPVLECARALNAPLVRVWAGKTDAKQAREDDWARVSDELRRACELAHSAGVEVATEFHGGTLTSSGQSARRLLDGVPGLQSLWQPLRRAAGFEPQIEANLADLSAVAPFLRNVHVYEWADDAQGARQARSLQGSAQWPRYVAELERIGGDRWLLLEFVPGDDVLVLAREAAALREWIGG